MPNMQIEDRTTTVIAKAPLSNLLSRRIGEPLTENGLNDRQMTESLSENLAQSRNRLLMDIAAE